MDVISLGYQTDLAIRRTEGSQITDCGDHIVVRSERNPGYWWGNFILLAGPPRAGDIDRWLVRFTALFPVARHRAFGVDVTDAAAVDEVGFAAAGLRAERNVVLSASSVIRPRQPCLAATVRQLAGDDDWRQSAALRLACFEPDPAAGPDASADEQEFDARKLAARRQLTETGRAAWFGAFAASRLVAQLGLVPTGNGLARYQDVETHPEFRRQGLAGRLVWQAGSYGLAELGAARLVIVADPSYHAFRLYESLGFRRAEDQVGFERTP
jgi:ribosomal protein S18 acetylase RimI-like enzyme